jgi:uncharacterized protein (DUF2062 family)
MHDFIFAVGLFICTIIGSIASVTLAIIVVREWISWYHAFRKIREERKESKR